MRGRLLTVGILALAAALIAGNMRHLLGHERGVRSKDLDFLPSPDVARVLACGQANSVARLRWIDAFAYFQLQLERKDDRVAGGHSGFERLYDLLIGLDPRFEPFYQHASLCLGGIVQRHQQELAYLQRGVLELPAATALRRSVATLLVTQYGWDRTQPANLDALLSDWADAETEASAKATVWLWKAGIARRSGGLEQIPYWLDRLGATAQGTPLHDFIDGIVREQLATYGLRALQAIADDRHVDGAPVQVISDLLDPSRLAGRGIDGALGPFLIADGALSLRCDPYGYDYVLDAGRVRSPGLEYARFKANVAALDTDVRYQVERAGLPWPDDLDAFASRGLKVPAAPFDAKLVYRDQRVAAELPRPPHDPLALR